MLVYAVTRRYINSGQLSMRTLFQLVLSTLITQAATGIHNKLPASIAHTFVGVCYNACVCSGAACSAYTLYVSIRVPVCMYIECAQ